MTDVIADRREAPRYAITLAAEVTEVLTSVALGGRSSDVSRTGCYIETLLPPPTGTLIRIQLHSGDEIFETAARVVYVCPGLGMGVHWGANPVEKQFAVLDRWLQTAAKSKL
jgi:hypothetical protein